MIKRPDGRQVFACCGVVCVDGKCEIRCPIPVTADVDFHAGDVHMPPSFKLRGYCEISVIPDSVTQDDGGRYYVGIGIWAIGPIVISELTIDEFRLAIGDSSWEVMSHGLWGCAEPTVLIS